MQDGVLGLWLVVPAGLLALCVACSASDGGKDASDSPTDTDVEFDTESDVSVDTGKSDTAPAPIPPRYWGLAGEVLLTAGAPDVTLSSVVLSGVDDTPDCDVTASIALVDGVVAPTDPAGLLTWWSWTLTPAVDAPCTWLGPLSVELGFGPTDVQLRPAGDRLGVHADTAYGLYARVGEGPVLLLGIAGLPEQLDGTVPALYDAPPADGTAPATDAAPGFRQK